jgi:hypothetical protein
MCHVICVKIKHSWRTLAKVNFSYSKLQTYRANGDKEYHWEGSHRQAVFDAQIYSNPPMKPNVDDALY